MKNEAETIQLTVVMLTIILVMLTISTCSKKVSELKLKCLNDGHSIEECKLL